MQKLLLALFLLFFTACQKEQKINEPDPIQVFTMAKMVMTQYLPDEYKVLGFPITNRNKKITKGAAGNENVPLGYYHIWWAHELLDDNGDLAQLELQVTLEVKEDCKDYIRYDCYISAQGIVQDQGFELNSTMLVDIQTQIGEARKAIKK
jgi:hypothetical protein